MNQEPTQQTIDAAIDGDKAALERLVRGVQDRVYNLSIRMLGHPDDAADATQEILIRIVTRLATFQQRSRFSTWAYRIAANHLIDTTRAKPYHDLSFDEMSERLGQPPNDIHQHSLELSDAGSLEREVFLGCSLAMLRCLDRDHRVAFILGAILELDSNEGAVALEITRAAFRKRLSRARTTLKDFVVPRCGLLSSDGPCHCLHQVNLNVGDGLIRPGQLVLTDHPCRRATMTSPDLREARSGVEELTAIARELHTLRAIPQFAAPDGLVPAITSVLESGRHKMLS